MVRRMSLAIALVFASHALGGPIPSADEVFARLRDRAQRLNGLRCTLEIQQERGPRRHRLEFRSPGHLRLERLPDEEPAWRRIWFAPQIAVVTPAERWTYIVRRDEVVTGPPDCESLWEFHPQDRPQDGWEGTARLFAALLASDAFYKDYEIRRPTEPSATEAARRLCSEMGLFEEAARWAVEEAMRRRPNAEVELELRTEAALLLAKAKQAEKAAEMWLSGVREALRQPMTEESRPRLIADQMRRFAAPAILAEADKGWVAQHWLPALEAAAKRLKRDLPAAERAAVEFPLGAAHRALGDNASAARHYARGLKLLPKADEGRKWLDEIAPDYPLDDF